MKQEACQAIVIFVGIGNDGKIKCYLAKQRDRSTGQIEFRATVVVSRVGGSLDSATIRSNGHEDQPGFNTFEEAAHWLEERCEEFSPLVELYPVPPEKSLCR